MDLVSIGIVVAALFLCGVIIFLYRQATNICEGHGSIRMQLVKDWDRLDRCGHCGHRLTTRGIAPVPTLRSGVRNWAPELLGRRRARRQYRTWRSAAGL